MATPRPVNDDELTSAELNTRPRDRVVGHERELRDSIVVRNACAKSYSYILFYDEADCLLLYDSTMLQMNTYLKAIARNKHLFKGKVCLDVGCGLGIRVSRALVLIRKQLCQSLRSQFHPTARDLAICTDEHLFPTHAGWF